MPGPDQIDISQREAITLKLIGLSQPTVQAIVHRRIAGLPHPYQRADRASEEHGMSESRFWTWSIKASPMIRRKN